MTNYTEHFSTKKTPQTQPIPGKSMIKNNAGGFGFQVDKWEQLERFLILGTEGNTYYQSENKMAVENSENVVACIKEDGLKALNLIVSISDSGRAPKNNAAIFALALCCTFGNQETKNHSYASITKVCRIGTHLFQFCQNIQDLRGWSRGLRKGVSQFFHSDKFAYDLIKYRQRNGWTHKDVMRLAHVPMKNPYLAKWILGKETPASEIPPIIWDYATMTKATSPNEVIGILKANPKLPWETIPTAFLKSKEVWEALIPNLPIHALTRNLGKMGSLGMFASKLSPETKWVMEKFSNKELVKKSRMHPLTALSAMKVYQSGHGVKGSLSWDVCGAVVDSLEEMFYLAFGNVEPTGKTHLLALDVSGSMTGGTIAGSQIKPFEATAAMAMVAARTEKNSEIIGFTGNIRKLGITEKDTLSSAMEKTHHSDFGNTNAAAAIMWAIGHALPIDVFIIYTDNESWSGPMHVSQALEGFRQASGRRAKLISVGLTATQFSVVDPTDPLQMNVVGFDTGAVEAMNYFVRK